MSIQFPNLGINLGYVGKSIQIFGFEITFFGLVIALGMLLGMGFVILEAKRCGENKDDYLEMMIMSLLLGVVGSRMLYVLCSWNLYKGNIIEIFNVRNGGLTFYGGLFGGSHLLRRAQKIFYADGRYCQHGNRYCADNRKVGRFL